MKLWLRLLAVAAILLAAAAGFARFSWQRATAQAVRQLNLVASPGPAYNPAQLEGLPAPVARYFRFALTPGQRLIRTASLQQEGEFALKPGQWVPFRAADHFSSTPAGFVWDADIRMMPLLPVLVRDSYWQGQGAMRGRVLGLFPVVDAQGTREMAEASLLRWLAEAVWLPTALLPRPGLRWLPVSEDRARVELEDSGRRVSLEMQFAPNGEVIGISALRHRDQDGQQILTPWTGRFSRYQRTSGMMVPLEAEVAWLINGHPAPYWRGHILHADYAF